ncbi:MULTISPECIES: NtrZ family periplasmic regulatory protein [Brevundimonas]|uniref:NtrZ family periplasmic regulatory protein n=1 Tax=Brevundimonas pishanensis TaxID=2896315 RepID=UPI001FA73CD1|nr:hypothetical protein [Brevundimonas pishanensis]
MDLGLMRIGVTGLAVVGALALASVSTDALAQSRSAQVGLAQAANTPAAERSGLNTQTRRGLRWNESGRWGLNLNLNQPVGRGTDWGDVEAGAFYRVNPRLRVGAAANLATRETDPARVEETDRRTQPRVRLETIFKF